MIPFYFNTTSAGQFYAAGYTLIWASLPSSDYRDRPWIDVLEFPIFCCEL